MAGSQFSLVKVGTVRARHARDITGSNWSVGAETMDRDYTVYRYYRDYLGPIGAKKARIQAGWAKTEKERGKYDWAWLDAIIRDMVNQGVEPWVCLCYGNPLYGGDIHLGSPLPTQDTLAAWLRFVGAFIERYGDVVDEWEVWNEPNLGDAAAPPGSRFAYNTPTTYANFFIATAETIRKRQPTSTIMAFSLAGVDIAFLDQGLAAIQAQGKLDLIDQVTYHPYAVNPDACYGKVEQMRALIGRYAGHITIRQGENGISSATGPGTWDAGRGADYSEHTQAKWATRRMLGDLGRDIPTSLFTMCDIHYKHVNQIAHFGFLATNPDQTVHHVKPVYHAMQHITAIFDDRLRRIPDYLWYTLGRASHDGLSVYGYQDAAGRQVATIWKNDSAPSSVDQYVHVDLALVDGGFADPVYVDVLTGGVYEIPAEQTVVEDRRVTLRQIPVYDSVVLIADRSLIPM